MSKTHVQQLQDFSRRVIIWFVILCFSLNLIAPQIASAQMAFLPQAGVMVQTSAVFTPVIITGMRLDAADPLKVDFLIDTGDDQLEGEPFKNESQKLINYFFAALTVPEDQMWVNLSPYEKDRIIAQPLSQTAMGRDMLAQDYLLKQLSASMLYPEDELGKKFWKRVQQKAQSQYGTTDIPLNTFNKIWIVPERAMVFVNDNNVFVSESHLKVMLEEDYLALKQHSAIDPASIPEQTGEEKIISGVSSDIVREILIPEIEKEINEGKNFAPLRQMFHALILAAWYKKNLKESVLGQIYVDQNKISGVDIAEKNIKEEIYNQYIAAFKKGVFDYIKEDVDPVDQHTIPRRYFSGGVDMAQLSQKGLEEGLTQSLRDAAATRQFKTVSTYAGLQSADQAIFVNEDDLEFHIEAARNSAVTMPGQKIKVFFDGELLAQFPHDTAFNIMLTLIAGKLRNKTKNLSGQFNMYTMSNEVHIQVINGMDRGTPEGIDAAMLSDIKKLSLIEAITDIFEKIAVVNELSGLDLFQSGEFLNDRGQAVQADVFVLWEQDPVEQTEEAVVDSVRDIQKHLAEELKVLSLYRTSSTMITAEKAPHLSVIKRNITGLYLQLPDGAGTDLIQRDEMIELIHRRLAGLLSAISLDVDYADQSMLGEAEDRLEIKVAQWGRVPEREENEREAERRASIEIRQQLGILYGELEQIIALRRDADTPEKYQAVELREQFLISQLRILFSDMPVKIQSGQTYEFYSQALKDLKSSRRKIARLTELAEARKKKEELRNLNLAAIRNNRLIVKVQILLAGMLLTAKSRDGIRHPVPALNALEGAINSANALEIELEYRIQRLRAHQVRKAFETNDWLGNRVRTYRLGTFDIDVEEKEGQAEPTVMVRQKRPINVHSRLDQIRLQANRGEVEPALEKIDELIGLYNLQYIITLESYKNISDDLKALKAVVSGLTPGEKLSAGEIKEDIKTRVQTLTANIQFPKQMVWADVPYKGLRKAFDGHVKKIASELAQYMVVLKNKTDLSYYAKKLKEAAIRKERGRKTPLSQHNREVIIEKLRELQAWTSRGFVTPKVFATIDLEPVITLIEADDFSRAEAHLQDVIGRLDRRLKDIDRIAANLKVSATSLFLEFRDNDITQRTNTITQAINEGEYLSALELFTELQQEYFDQGQVEPGLIRAGQKVQKAIRLLSGRTPNRVTVQVLNRITQGLKEDIRHKSKFKINITNEQKQQRVYFVEPGTTIQGLLNIGKRNAARVNIILNGKRINRPFFAQTRLQDENRIVITADQAIINEPAGTTVAAPAQRTVKELKSHPAVQDYFLKKAKYLVHTLLTRTDKDFETNLAEDFNSRRRSIDTLAGMADYIDSILGPIREMNEQLRKENTATDRLWPDRVLNDLSTYLRSGPDYQPPAGYPSRETVYPLTDKNSLTLTLQQISPHIGEITATDQIGRQWIGLVDDFEIFMNTLNIMYALYALSEDNAGDPLYFDTVFHNMADAVLYNMTWTAASDQAMEADTLPPVDDGFLRPYLITSPVNPVFVHEPNEYVPGRRLYGDRVVRQRVIEHLRGYLEIALAHGKKQSPKAHDLLDNFLARPALSQLTLREIEDIAYNYIKDLANVREPMSAYKIRALEITLELIPELQAYVADSRTTFERGLKSVELALKGNITSSTEFRRLVTGTDYKALVEHIHSYIEEDILYHQRDSVSLVLQLMDKKPKKVVYLFDNIIEYIYDLPLILFILKGGHQVTLVGKEVEADNDVTVDDIKTLLYLDEVKEFLGEYADNGQIQVVSSGSRSRGTDLRRATPAFTRAWAEADLIISKGEGNRGTLKTPAGLTKDIYFITFSKAQYEVEDIPVGLGAVEYVSADAAMLGDYTDFFARMLHVRPSVVAYALGETLDRKVLLEKWDDLVKAKGINYQLDEEMTIMLTEALNQFGRPYDSSKLVQFFVQRSARFQKHLERSPTTTSIKIWLNSPIEALELDYPTGFFNALIYLLGNSVDWVRFVDLVEYTTGRPLDQQVKNIITNKELVLQFNLFNASTSRMSGKRYFNSFAELVDFYRMDEHSEVALLWGSSLLIEDILGDVNEVVFDHFNDGINPTAVHAVGGHFFDASIIRRVVVLSEPYADEAMVGTASQRRTARNTLQRQILAAGGNSEVFSWIKNETVDKATRFLIRDGAFSIEIDRKNNFIRVKSADQAILSSMDKDKPYTVRELHAHIEAIEQMLMVLSPNHKDIDFQGIISSHEIEKQPKPVRMFTVWLSDNTRRFNKIDPKLVQEILGKLGHDLNISPYTLKNNGVVTQAFLGFPTDKILTQYGENDFIKKVFKWLIDRQAMLLAISVKVVDDPFRDQIIREETQPLKVAGTGKRLYMLPDAFYQAYKSKIYPIKVIDILRADDQELTNVTLLQVIPQGQNFELLVRTQDGQEISITDAVRIYSTDFAMVAESFKSEKVFINDIRQQREGRSGLDAVLQDRVPPAQRDVLLAVTQFLELFTHAQDRKIFDGISARSELAANPDVAAAFIRYIAHQETEHGVQQEIDKTKSLWLRQLFDLGIKNIRTTSAETVLRQDDDPVAVVFDGKALTHDSKVKEIVFTYKAGYFYAITQIVDHEDGKGNLAEGGLRYKSPLEKDKSGKYVVSDRAAFELFKNVYAETDMISRSKYYRNTVTQTPYAGAKTVMVVHPDAANIKGRLLRGFASALVDSGLASRYVIGTESGMSASDQNTLSEAIKQRYLQHLQYELEMIKTIAGENLTNLRTTEYGGILSELEQGTTVNGKFLQDPLIDILRQRVVAMLPLGRQNGGTSLVKLFNSRLKDDLPRIIGAATTGRLTKEEDVALKEWSLAAYSSAMSVESIVDYLQLNKKDLKIGIKGATTGGSLALMLTRLGYTIVAMEDLHGTVYKPEGFSLVELQRLETINLNNRNLTKWLPAANGARHLPSGSILDRDQVDLDIFISASPGRTINEKTIQTVRGKNDVPGRQPLIYIESGFNSFEGYEKALAEKGILALKSTSIGFGGAYGSWLEDYIKHRFTSVQLQRYILRTAQMDVVAESNPRINEHAVLTKTSETNIAGDIVVENGKVVASGIEDILVGMSVDMNTGQVYSHGIDLNYHVKDLERTIVWGNYLVVQDNTGRIVKSNHPDLPAGTAAKFIDPVDEIKDTAYNDIAGISYRMNTMVMELVQRGFTPTQAVIKIADLISAKKERLEHTKDSYITQAITDITDHLEREGFFLPPYIARKIAVKRLVAASDIGITLNGGHYIFDSSGRLQAKNESETLDGYGNIRFESAKRGSYDINLEQAVAAEKALAQQAKRQETPAIFIRQPLPSLNTRIGIPDEVKGTSAGTIEEQGLGKAVSQKREQNPEAIRYIHDQREQKKNRSGLDQVLADIAPAQRDILLGTTQFLEILSHYESKQGKGEVFDSIAARKELVDHPQIAKAMLAYHYHQMPEQDVLTLLGQENTRWLKILFERGIKLIKHTNADVAMRDKNEAIAIRFDGVQLTGIDIKKELIFIYLPDRFYAITQLVDISKADHTKGGIRYAEPVARANDPLKRTVDEVALDIMKGAYNDLNNLSVSQYSKNVLAGIGYAGAKTYFGVSQDALPLKDSLLKAWATAMVDVGLMEVYDGGPDVGMSSSNQETIIAGIIKRYTDHLKNEVTLLRAHGVDLYSLTLSQYGRALKEIETQKGVLFLRDALIESMRRRLIQALPKGRENGSFILEKVFTGQLSDEIQKIIGSAVTGGSARVGAISHVDLAVTGQSTLSSIEAIINYLGLEPTKLKVAVIGAGDVGGSIALKLARKGYLVVAISDINGAVYKPQGFTVAELQNLNNVQPGDRNVLQWLPEQTGVRHLSGTDILNKDVVDIDLLVPAAMGGIVNDKTIDLLRGAGEVPGREPLIIIEGSNNAFVGMEARLAAKGILAVSGMSVNFGGVKGSTKEAMLKHLRTVRELREITLKKSDGQSIRTSTRTQVNETIDVLTDDGTTKAGTLVVHNGNVVRSDIAQITIGANLDPLNGRLYNRGDDLGYRIGSIVRELSWFNYIVRMDADGKILASNHPDINTGETFTYVDPLDVIKSELYAEIDAIATRNNIMVMELTGLGMNPTEAVVKLANALGMRKAEIYEATEGPDAHKRDKIVDKFKQDGYFMVDHIARNIASIQLAAEGELSVEAGDRIVTFDADGRIKTDSAVLAENLTDLERGASSTVFAFNEESAGRKNPVSKVQLMTELDYLFANLMDNKNKDIQRRAAQLYRFAAMATQRTAALDGDPFKEFLHAWLTVLQPTERMFRRYLKNLARGEGFHFLIQTDDPERPRRVTGQDIADQQGVDLAEFVKLADAFINLIQLRENLNQAALADLAKKLLDVPAYYPDSAQQGENPAGDQAMLSRVQVRAMAVDALTQVNTQAEINEPFIDALHRSFLQLESPDRIQITALINHLLEMYPNDITRLTQRQEFVKALTDLLLVQAGEPAILKSGVLERVPAGKFYSVEAMLRELGLSLTFKDAVAALSAMPEIDMFDPQEGLFQRKFAGAKTDAALLARPNVYEMVAKALRQINSPADVDDLLVDTLYKSFLASEIYDEQQLTALINRVLRLHPQTMTSLQRIEFVRSLNQLAFPQIRDTAILKAVILDNITADQIYSLNDLIAELDLSLSTADGIAVLSVMPEIELINQQEGLFKRKITTAKSNTLRWIAALAATGVIAASGVWLYYSLFTETGRQSSPQTPVETILVQDKPDDRAQSFNNFIAHIEQLRASEQWERAYRELTIVQDRLLSEVESRLSSGGLGSQREFYLEQHTRLQKQIAEVQEKRTAPATVSDFKIRLDSLLARVRNAMTFARNASTTALRVFAETDAQLTELEQHIGVLSRQNQAEALNRIGSLKSTVNQLREQIRIYNDPFFTKPLDPAKQLQTTWSTGQAVKPDAAMLADQVLFEFLSRAAVDGLSEEEELYRPSTQEKIRTALKQHGITISFSSMAEFMIDTVTVMIGHEGHDIDFVPTHLSIRYKSLATVGDLADALKQGLRARGILDNVIDVEATVENLERELRKILDEKRANPKITAKNLVVQLFPGKNVMLLPEENLRYFIPLASQEFFEQDLAKAVFAIAGSQRGLQLEGKVFRLSHDTDGPFVSVSIEDAALLSDSDQAPGGIDFNTSNMDLEETGGTFQFKESVMPLNGMTPQQINGIQPVIINITPVTNLFLLLGLKKGADDPAEQHPLEQPARQELSSASAGDHTFIR